MSTTFEPQEAPAAVETPMAAPAPAPAPAPRKRRKGLLIVGGIVLVAVIAAVLALVLGGSKNDKVTSVQKQTGLASPLNAFKVALPATWRSDTKKELAAAPGSPLSVLRRKDGSAVVVIRRAGKLPTDLNAFTRQLDRQFRGKLHSAFQRQSAKVLNQRSGKAFNYVYINRRKGTVNSVTVVPAKRGSFTLNSVAQGGKKSVASEVGRIIVSFDDR